MPIKDQKAWDTWVESNDDPYGKTCVDVARRVMEILDQESDPFDPHQLMCRADITDNMTGFMAGCVAQMVSVCHSRGEEFRQKWNLDNQIQDEGEKANKGNGVLNPALMCISEEDR